MGLIMIIVTDDGNLDPTRRDLAERARHGIQQIARCADDGQTGGTSWGYDRYSTLFGFTAVKWLTAEAIMDARPMVRATRPSPRPGPEIGASADASRSGSTASVASIRDPPNRAAGLQRSFHGAVYAVAHHRAVQVRNVVDARTAPAIRHTDTPRERCPRTPTRPSSGLTNRNLTGPRAVGARTLTGRPAPAVRNLQPSRQSSQIPTHRRCASPATAQTELPRADGHRPGSKMTPERNWSVAHRSTLAVSTPPRLTSGRPMSRRYSALGRERPKSRWDSPRKMAAISTCHPARSSALTRRTDVTASPASRSPFETSGTGMAGSQASPCPHRNGTLGRVGVRVTRSRCHHITRQPELPIVGDGGRPVIPSPRHRVIHVRS